MAAAAGAEALKSESPLIALLRLRALLATDERDETALSLGIEATVVAIRERGRLFAALVRYLSVKALERDDWLTLEPAAFVSFVWLFADALTQIMAPPGTDLNALADAVQARSAYGLSKLDALAAILTGAAG